MPTDRQLDETISGWLEAEAPRQLPDRVLRATFEQTRKTGQRGRWRALLGSLQVNRMMSALGGGAAVVVVASLGLGLYFNNQQGVGAPPSEGTPAAPTFDGNWESTDVDDSHLTMAIVAQPNGTYDITMRDDVASVCDGGPSTLTGTARPAEAGTIVIAQPGYTCDDGSETQRVSPPLEEQLKDLTFAYDFQRDILQGSLFNLVWSRVSPTAPEGTPAPAPTEEPNATEPTGSEAAAFDGSWESTDVDDSHQTMEVHAQPNGTYEVTVLDDMASVCYGASSTMTGVAETLEPGTIVIAQPEYTCDDGSETQRVSPPLDEQLKDFTFTYDFQRDELEDSLGLVWSRDNVPDGTPAATTTEEPDATEPTGSEATAFAGSWGATDSPPDSSHLTMTIDAQPDGTYELTIRDDLASVCGGASSTMTGVADAGQAGTIVIAQPKYTCNDGSEAQALSGPPLLDQLRDLSFTYDSQRDELEDSLGLVWSRV